MGATRRLGVVKVHADITCNMLCIMEGSRLELVLSWPNYAL